MFSIQTESPCCTNITIIYLILMNRTPKSVNVTTFLRTGTSKQTNKLTDIQDGRHEIEYIQNRSRLHSINTLHWFQLKFFNFFKIFDFFKTFFSKDQNLFFGVGKIGVQLRSRQNTVPIRRNGNPFLDQVWVRGTREFPFLRIPISEQKSVGRKDSRITL